MYFLNDYAGEALSVKTSIQKRNLIALQCYCIVLEKMRWNISCCKVKNDLERF